MSEENKLIIEPPPEPLEESFSLGQNQELTNKDLGIMQLKANKSTNYLVRNMQTLAKQVSDQKEIIDILRDIKKYLGIASTILGFVGTIGLVISIYNWMSLHFYH